MDKVFRNVKSFIKFYNLEISDPILVGFSGGADSVFLSIALKNLFKNKIILLHVNHKIRTKKEIDKDILFLKDFSKKNNFEYILEEVDVKKLAIENKYSIEVAARKARYNIYKKYSNIGNIALGHNLKDSFEWFIFTLLKGRKNPFIYGILPTNKFIVRPLLWLSSEDIRSYLKEKNILFREDVSNKNTKIPRNYIRLKLIPLLSNINPSFLKSFRDVSITGDFFSQDIRKINIDIDSKKVYNLEDDFFIFIKRYPFLKLRDISRLIEKGKLVKNNLVFEKVKKTVFVEKIIKPFKDCKKEMIETDKLIKIKRIGLYLKATFNVSKNNIVLKDNYEAVFDTEKLNGGLYLRCREEGDKMFIVNLGKKKIKDIFIDKKVPSHIRDIYPLVCDNKDILWIPGLARSKKAMVDPNTKKSIYLKSWRYSE